MNPLLSIITPVYNSEKTLRKCIESVINQKFHDWELILIDDGSRDLSGEIADEYADQDVRIRTFHRDNRGVSAARNFGIKIARGKWITFVDSDDYLYDTALDIDLMNANEELIFCSYYTIKNENKNLYQLVDNTYYETLGLSSFYKNIDHPIFGVIWSKFYRKDILNDVFFDENIRIGEDTLFMMTLLKRVKSIKTVENILYVYNIPENFVSKYNLKVDIAIYVLVQIFSAYRELNIRSKKFEKRLFLDYKLFCQSNIYKDVNSWYKNKEICTIYNYIKDAFPVEYRILYFLMSNVYISKVVNYFRRNMLIAKRK